MIPKKRNKKNNDSSKKRKISYPKKSSRKRSHKKNKQSGKKQHQWLDWLNIHEGSKHREVHIELHDNIHAGFITADAFTHCPDGEYKGIVYEFWGDYWHGNLQKYASDKYNKVCKKTMLELWNKTQEKRQRIINAGYFLVEIWESDWEKIKVGGTWNLKIDHGVMTYKARKLS